MTSVQHLRQLAEAATSGPWRVDPESRPIMVESESVTWPLVDDGQEVGRTGAFICNAGDSITNGHANADFIAAMSPDVALRVIAVVEAAQAWHETPTEDSIELLTADLKLHAALQALKGISGERGSET